MPTSLLEKKSVASQTSTGEVSVSPLRIGSVPRYEESSKQEALDSLLIQKTEWSALQLKSTSAEPEAQLPIQEKEHICAPSRSESLTCPYTGTTPRTGSDGMSKLSYSSTSVPSVGATTLPTTKESLKQVLQDSSLPQKTEEKETMSEPERETFRKPPSCTFDVPVDYTVSEAAHEQKKMSLDHISAVPSVGTTVVQCTSAESFGSISTLTPSVDTTVAQYSPADSFSSISTLMPSVATAAVQFPSVTSLHTIKPPLPTSERSLKQAVQSHSQVMTGMYEVPYIAGATETHSCHTPVQSRPSFQRVYISAPLESEGLTCFHSGKTTPRSDSVKRFSSTSVPKVSTIEVQLPSVNSIHAIKPPLLTSEESSEKATQDSSFPLKTEQPALMMKESMSEPETEPFIRYIYRRPPSDIFEGPLEDVSTARHTLSKTTVKESIECAINETAVSEVRHEEQKISLEHFSASRLKLGLKETLLDSPLPQKSEPSVLTAEPERELLTHSHSQVLAGSYEMPYIAGASETLSSHAPVQSRSLVQHEDISVPLEAVPRISQRVLCSAPVPTVNTATFQFPSFTSVRYITPSLPTSKQSSKQAMHDSSFPQKMEETRTKSETEPLIKYYYQQPPSDTSVVPPESDNLTHCYSDTAVPVSGSDRISKRFISEPSVTISYGQFPTIHPLQTTESSSSASFSKESSKEAVLYFPLSQKNTVSSPPVTPVTSQEVATHQISDVECCCVPTKDDPSVQTEYDAEKQAQETVSSDESSACDETTVVRLHIKYTPSVSPLPSKHSAKQKLLETQNFFPGPQETMSVEVYSKLILSSPKRQLQSQGKIPKEGKRDVGYQEAVSESQDAAVARLEDIMT
ncbi:mucin-5AC-like [Protopterus annectens]|uniref:mucin-5AC-like n=1 Tax=Protopterus annectens TaxID=7888 RepID=UPI001CF9B568|nr:mucin-5AC-like [Protopterus annectens]